jgi:hypothetical protein
MNTPTPTPSKDEVNLDNLPLKDALRFVDENSTTGGLFTKAALKTLAAKCRELTAVTEQRDRLEKQRDLLIEVLEVTLNATVLNHRRDRWHSDAEYALNKIKLNLKYE